MSLLLATAILTLLVTLFPAVKREDETLKVSFSTTLGLDLITQFVDEAAILGS